MSREQESSPSGGGDGGGQTEKTSPVPDGTDGQYQLDADGQFVAVSDGFVDLVGRSHESLLGKHVSAVLSPADRDRYGVAADRLTQDGPLAETELAVCLVDADGAEIPCTVTLRSLAGAETGWESLGTVTRRETTEPGIDRARLYEEIVENAPETAFLIDSDRTVSYVSEQIESDFQGGVAEFTSEPLVAATEETIADEETRQRYLDLVDDLLAGERTEARMEVPLATPGESIIDIRLSAVESDSEVEVIIGTTRDVTEQVEQRRALQRERDLNDQLLETAPIGINVHGEDGAIIRANERAETILGLATAELDSAEVEELSCTFLDEDGNEVPVEQMPAQRVIETGEPVFGAEYQVVHPNGRKRWVIVNSAPVVGQDGDVDRVVCAFVDITEHREREGDLEAERAFTEAILDAIPDMVYAFDDHGRPLRWNDRVLDITGYSESTVQDMYVFDFVPEADQPTIEQALEQVYQGSVERREASLLTADGEQIPYDFSAAPITSESGELLGFAGVGRDITDQQARERRLREQNERLERLNRVNAVIRDVHQALVQATTREEIETAVCERLAAADAYEFAWIGTQRRTDNTLVPQAMAGPFEAYLEEVTVRTDEHPSGQGPAGSAYRTREIQVCQDIHSNPPFESATSDLTAYVDTIDSFGFRSIASIPITYDDTCYGILSVYAAEPYSFGAMEQAVLAELGETIGHAISGLQAKQALVSERVTELTITIGDEDIFPISLSAQADCRVIFEGSTTTSEGDPVHYMTVEGASADRVEELSRLDDGVRDLRVVESDEEGCVVELHALDPSVLRVFSDHGGQIEHAEAADGVAEVIVELPQTSDTHTLLETLRERFDDVNLRAQHETDRSVQTSHQFRSTVADALTDRQQAALEIAHHGSYFDWPRESTGEELATVMGVSAPTFHKHLRLAEQKLASAVLDGETDEPEG